MIDCDIIWMISVAVLDAKQVLVGAGARALFYPTLLYNVLRNKIQSKFRWWDRVDEFIRLGAVPFPTNVPRLKELGVSGVVTLNEPYETLVPTSLYHAHDIAHLVIPTRDYLFAPSSADICQAVNFIHENGSNGKTTYVHCKVQHRHMTPDAAYEYVRSIRPRVLLASSQWQVKEAGSIITRKRINFLTQEETKRGIEASDDSTFVVVTELDLEGYDRCETGVVDDIMLGELSLACRVQFASQAAISRLSCLWLGYHANHKHSRKKHRSSLSHDQLRSLTVDIQVY